MPNRLPPSVFSVPFSAQNGNARMQLLTPAEQKAIAAMSRLVELKRDTTLYWEDEPSQFVYNIIAGAVSTYHLQPNGLRQVTSFLFPGDLVGLSRAGKYVTTAHTLTAVVAYKIPYHALESLVHRDPKLDTALLCKLCDDLRRSERHFMKTTQHEALSRVAAFLVWLAGFNVDVEPDPYDLYLPMLRQDIADYLDLSIETISRAMHELEQQGAIRRDTPRHLHILDLEQLKLIAQM